MIHFFVAMVLLTCVWTADGQVTPNGQIFKDANACRAAKLSFEISEVVITSKQPFSLRDEFAAQCVPLMPERMGSL